MAVAAVETTDDLLRRVPPQDLTAEQSVLGAVLVNNEALHQARKVVKPQDFYREGHREIFRAMEELGDRDQPIDASTLTGALRTRGKLEAIGGPAYIAALAACVPTALHVFSYARTVRDKAELRSLISTIHEIATGAYNGAATDAAAYAENAVRRIETIASRLRPKPAAIGEIASDVSEVDVEWLMQDQIARRKSHDVIGLPGVGKSTWMITLAAQLTLQGLNVAMLSAEDDPSDTSVPRAREAGADLSRIRFIPSAFKTRDGMKPIVLPDDLSILEEAILADNSAALFIDPITAFLAERVDSHKDASLRKVLAELAALAVRTNCAIVWLRHVNKNSSESSAMLRGGGSIAFIAAARVAFLIGYDPNDDAPIALRKRVVAQIKNNLAPLGSSRAFRLIADEGAKVAHIEWVAEPCTLTADDLLVTRDPRQAEASEEASEFLRDELAEGERPSAEVERHARALGISQRTLYRTRKRLGVVSRKKTFGGEWLISLPKSAVADEEQPATTPVEEAQKVRI